MTRPAGVTLIWAQSAPAADCPAIIGRAGRLPWRVPEDLARFRGLTRGRTVIMGRRTWDSLPAAMRPLPDRRNIVITRDPDWSAAGAQTATSVDEAFELAAADPTFVIGGGEIYAATIGRATRLEVTEIRFPAGPLQATDTCAPAIDEHWQPSGSGDWLTSASGLAYRFTSYVRAAAGSPLGDQRA